MKPFRYQPAGATAEAVGAANRPGARFLAGGTNLVDLMKLGVETPDLLVDISRLGLDEVVELPGGGVRIGATVRNSDLAVHPVVRRSFPALSQALLSGASGQLRNLATVGGNLLQRTRCLYFQDVSKPCNKREPGSGCPAREGEHRNLAILGASPACVATHPSDMAVALAAFDGSVQVEGPDGAHAYAVHDFYRLPGDAPQLDTNLPPGSLVTAVEVPGLHWATRSVYRKVRDRVSYAFAVVSIAAALDVEDGTVRDVRLALGGVAHAPWRARLAEQVLRGRPVSDEAFREAANAELSAAEPLRDNGFKVPLASNLIVRTLRDLSEVGP